MNKITEVTRRDIIDILTNGIVNSSNFFETHTLEASEEVSTIYKISYHGRLSEIDFLKRVYDLADLPSNDRRFSDAETDIWQHTVNNYDWDEDWVFTDRRFELSSGKDDILLNFLCEVFNPVVRNESQPWKKILSVLNQLLNIDGYELYEKGHISGRVIYGWRESGDKIIEISNRIYSNIYKLKLIGEGSYAKVFKYEDNVYQKTFVLKRAKTNLSSKELERFKREYEQMKTLNSPYVVEVYSFNESKYEYIMEYMDLNLEKFIMLNNGKLSFSRRKNISLQIIKGFKYIHSMGLLHRDICPKNILVRKYDDVEVFKISDFGLVKIPESNLTSINTEYKGYFNDPELRLDGFSSYSIAHEMYAITRVIYYVMTGKTNTEKISNESLKSFVLCGLNPNKKDRFQDIEQLSKSFYSVIE